METIILTVEPRQSFGKEEAGRIRRSGKVPGIFYSAGKQATSLTFDEREFHLKFAGLEGAHLVQLHSSHPDLQGKLALLKEVQKHPLTSNLIHIDFYGVDINKPIQVTVPLHFQGKAEGVTTGGILQTLMRDLLVECLPGNIPEFVEVDVTPLKIHDSLHITDIILPSGVKAVSEMNEAVVTVVAPMVAAPAPEEETEGEEAPTTTPAETEKEK